MVGRSQSPSILHCIGGHLVTLLRRKYISNIHSMEFSYTLPMLTHLWSSYGAKHSTTTSF